MRVRIELTEKDLREMVLNHIRGALGDLTVELKDIEIQVKSTQNYRAEWETAAFRAVFERERG